MIAPERITLYCKPKDEDGVYHAFPVDSSNSNHDTAKSWAKEQKTTWRDGKCVYLPTKDPAIFEFLNVDFDDVTIESLDIRSEGGRAYQVILRVDENKFRVDLREDTLMDVIRNTGIQAGGRLNGTFCFAKDGSQTKLIREGTELHKRAVAEREKRDTFNKTIKRSELKPGYQYSTHTGSADIFLGFVYTCDIDKDNGAVSKPYKALLFCDDYEKVHEFLQNGVIAVNERGYKEVSSYHFKILKSHSYKVEGKQVVDDNLSKYVKHIQAVAKAEYDDKIATQNYSRYPEEYTKSLALAGMSIDKKDVNVPAEEGKRIIQKVQEYNNRYYRRW